MGPNIFTLKIKYQSYMVNPLSIGGMRNIMSLAEYLTEIESEGFFARLAIASDARLFLRFAQKQTVVTDLVGELKGSDFNCFLVTLRAYTLLAQDYDGRYVRLPDMALAIYVWALYLANSPSVHDLAETLAATDGLWWAEKVARRVLAELWPATDTEEQTISMYSVPTIPTADSTSTKTAFASGIDMGSPSRRPMQIGDARTFGKPLTSDRYANHFQGSTRLTQPVVRG